MPIFYFASSYQFVNCVLNACRKADQKFEEASNAINKVLDAVAAAKAKKLSGPEISNAESLANKALYQLDQAQARISTVQSEAKVVEEYRDLVIIFFSI